MCVCVACVVALLDHTMYLYVSVSFPQNHHRRPATTTTTTTTTPTTTTTTTTTTDRSGNARPTYAPFSRTPFGASMQRVCAQTARQDHVQGNRLASLTRERMCFDQIAS